MQARLLWDDSIAVTGEESTLVFNRVWAGVGWPEADQGAVCVVAESTERVYHALMEWRGSLYELGSAALTARTDLLVDSFLIDDSDEVSTAYFRGLEFCPGSLQTSGKRRTNHEQLFMASSRKSSQADYPAIIGIRPCFRDNFRASLETLRGIAASERLNVHQKHCPSLAFALKRDLDFLLRSPVVKALVWALTAMESTRDKAVIEVWPEDGWYHNLSR